MEHFDTLRRDMVLQQLQGRGIRNAHVLAAMRKVPRHVFVDRAQREASYNDGPLPIGSGQTISQPYVVALMCELLDIEHSSNVLEIGTGSGYAAAVLAELSDQVSTLERLPELAALARANLKEAGYSGINVVCADGSIGYAERAPYDAIIVAAGAPAAPEKLKQQLKIGGRLVIPVGTSRTFQDLVRIRRLSETEFKAENLGGVAFVPLVGVQGWSDSHY